MTPEDTEGNQSVAMGDVERRSGPDLSGRVPGWPVKIKRLEILGFKSFVDPAEFVIEPGLTGYGTVPSPN